MNHRLKRGDTIVFLLNGKKYTGKVLVVDNGTFTDRDNVYCDILVETEDGNENKCLFKHIKESDIELLA